MAAMRLVDTVKVGAHEVQVMVAGARLLPVASGAACSSSSCCCSRPGKK